MGELTRRTLITQASVSAGAIGVLTVAAACAPSNTNASNAANTPVAPSTSTTGDPLAVFVTDPVKGTLKIMKGDREIIVTNPTLAKSLLSLI